MSDFLKKFSNQEYKNIKKPKGQYTPGSHEPDKEDFDGNTAKNQLENLETASNKNILKTANTKDEKFIKDNEIHRKKQIILFICIITTVVLGIIGYRIYYQTNQITVPNFTIQKSLNDVEVWAAKHKIQLDYTEKFSIAANENFVISQSIQSGETIQKGGTISIVISKGANPSEHLSLPDFKKMDLIKIANWKEKNKATNVTIDKVFNDTYKNGSFISMEFKTPGIDNSNYRRKDKLLITVSKGSEVFEKNISVPDFKNKSKNEVVAWAKEKDVKIEFEEQASSTIQADNIISQSIESKTKIAKNETIKVVVSKGKVSYVPNFYSLNEAQSVIEAAKSDVVIFIVKYYSDTIPACQLISQSLPTGYEIKDQTVVLVYSLGKPYIANFDGQSSIVLIQSINEMNNQGANISYTINEIPSKEAKGCILSTNWKASFVGIGTNIIMNVSSGE